MGPNDKTYRHQQDNKGLQQHLCTYTLYNTDEWTHLKNIYCAYKYVCLYTLAGLYTADRGEFEDQFSCRKKHADPGIELMPSYLLAFAFTEQAILLAPGQISSGN